MNGSAPARHSQAGQAIKVARFFIQHNSRFFSERHPQCRIAPSNVSR